jgi:hypothetical protein
MLINLASGRTTAALADTAPAEPGRQWAWLTMPGLAGIGYSLSWIAGLSVPAPSPRLGATGGEVVAAALARFARHRGRPVAGPLALVSGLLAAAIAAAQAGLGLALAVTSAPGPAYLLSAGVDRLDGVKMLALAVLGAAAAATTGLPRWLRWTAVALAVAITGSGLVYLLLAAALAAAAGPALVLLLVFMTGCGIMTGMRTDPRDR